MHQQRIETMPAHLFERLRTVHRQAHHEAPDISLAMQNSQSAWHACCFGNAGLNMSVEAHRFQSNCAAAVSAVSNARFTSARPIISESDAARRSNGEPDSSAFTSSM